MSNSPVTVCTTLQQTDANGVKTVIESRFNGVLSHRNGKTLVVYDEPEQQGRTWLQISQDEAMIRRQSNEVRSVMRLRTTVVAPAKYEVQGLSLAMSIKTHRLCVFSADSTENKPANTDEAPEMSDISEKPRLTTEKSKHPTANLGLTTEKPGHPNAKPCDNNQRYRQKPKLSPIFPAQNCAVRIEMTYDIFADGDIMSSNNLQIDLFHASSPTI